MITHPVLIIALISILCSCQYVENKSGRATEIKDTSKATKGNDDAVTIHDTLKRFMADDYPVTDSMFGSMINKTELKSGKLRSLDKLWFSNNNIGQVLVFELYTDNHRLSTYHFYNTHIPPQLIRNMELNLEDGDTASPSQKWEDFKGFLSRAQHIHERYFTTNKGCKLGDGIDKAIGIYGAPDRSETSSGVTAYYWEFPGELLYDGKTDLKGKPLVTDNYGHQVSMFFRKNKLVGLILHNDIP
jgi:hypothetical protein